ncbi:isochorismatase family protein [Gluconobacter morbifer]|uniref:nicotinamidase n=1 Tax=Gluconobacter morbifer G707 TaxID=1088869 RepID=G6XIM5_9PROT|nr:isochorismatase family protein [Gluconobacter morbifer]EHH68665.1 pyrazinamidase/nicotinamidase [Gluconobacter morbifer G707]
MTGLSRSALIIVDMQNDFLPGGALAVPGGDCILKAVNTLSTLGFRAVIATQDWHPALHCSFQSQHGPWPAHCIAGTDGAAFSPLLDTRPVSHIIRKGMAPDRDSYSAFFDNDHHTSTGLDGLLLSLDINHVILCGLALDYCVSATAQDAIRTGFRTEIVPQACRGIAAFPEATLESLQRAGVGLSALLSEQKIS